MESVLSGVTDTVQKELEGEIEGQFKEGNLQSFFISEADP